MKIAIIVNKFPVLSETFIINQIIGMIERGHHVQIFSHKGSEDPKIHPDVMRFNLLERLTILKSPENCLDLLKKTFPIILVKSVKGNFILLQNLIRKNPYGRKFIFELLYSSASIISENCFDVIYCHFGQNGNFCALLKKLGLLKGKLVTVFHGADMTTFVNCDGRSIYENLFREGDMFLPISDLWKNKLISWGCDEQKVLVHRMGIDTFNFRSNLQEKNDNSIEILSVGRLVEKKGFEFGIRAIAKIVKGDPTLKLSYNIAGDGPLREQLDKIIGECEVQKEVKLLGWKDQKEISELMNSAHIFLAPSVTSAEGDQEGLPVVLMEALCKELIVCSTYHSGIPELITNGENGFLVPERDVDRLCETIKFIIKSKAHWPEYRKKGRDKVFEKHDIHKLNESLSLILEGLHS
jgi:colanic acid/amylovoran biosynthesis glycosyltransferase